MSYRSRLYNQRNAQTAEGKDKPFFSKQQQGKEAHSKQGFFQAKLAVNKPGDTHEKEADAMAARVTEKKQAGNERPAVQRLSTEEESKMPSTNDGRMAEDKRIQEKPLVQKAADKKEEEKPVQKLSADKEKDKVQKKDKMPKEEEKPGLQKAAAGKKEEEKPVQKMEKPVKEEAEKKPAGVQTKQEGNPGTTSEQVDSKIEKASGKGNALPKKTLQEMSASFGRDFSNVRVHTDAEAAALCQELNAQAFTHGSDIYFNEGKFDPAGGQGKFLLAHELTHVVQQGAGSESIQRDLAVDPANPDVDAPVLTPKKIKDAILFNKERYGQDSVQLIQDITGATVTGIMDDQTVEFVALFQAQNGLKADGMVGPDTFNQITAEMDAEGASSDSCLNMFLVNVTTPMEMHAAGPGRANLFGNFDIEIRFSPHCDCSTFEYRQFIGGDVTQNGVNINNLFSVPGGGLPGLGNFVEDGNTSVAGNGRLGHRNLAPNLAAQNEYVDANGNIDMQNGCIYRTNDQPGLTNAQANSGDTYVFDIRFFGDIRKNGKMIERKFWAVRETIIIP